jgi:hypothetical protein
MTLALSPQMFALLDAMVTGARYEDFEPFPPAHTVKALIRRGLLEERQIKRNPKAPSYDDIMASIGCTHLVPTDAGRKLIADQEIPA